MADKQNGSAGNKAPGGMTKKAAVEMALGELGDTSTPTQLKKHIWERFHIEMDLKHISTEKAKILNNARQSQPAAARPAVQQPTAGNEAAKTGTPRGNGTPGISLTDIETVKDLVERVGAPSLKKLIDVMAR